MNSIDLTPDVWLQLVQLVEHRTGIAEVRGLNPVEALIISGFFFPIPYGEKFTVMIILHFHLQPQFKHELFHKYFTSMMWSIIQFQCKLINCLLPPQGFGPEAKTRGGTLGFPACIHIRNFKNVKM